MGWYSFGIAVAGIGAVAHVGFAYIETFGWGVPVVRNIAPSWLEGINDTKLAEEHVDWAKRLAFNIGVYNLMLGIALAWTCWAFAIQLPLAPALGKFFAIWLLGVAAAALYTKVFRAFIAQGLFGALLLFASVFP